MYTLFLYYCHYFYHYIHFVIFCYYFSLSFFLDYISYIYYCNYCHYLSISAPIPCVGVKLIRACVCANSPRGQTSWSRRIPVDRLAYEVDDCDLMLVVGSASVHSVPTEVVYLW
jgi:hypothetical protein